jgi:NADPH:quinone reductase-like Zn-dependent oxidoreductase
MKAAVHRAYGPPEEVVHTEDIGPPVPGDDDVLVRVSAAGVNWADASMTIGKPYVMRVGYGFRSPRKGVRGTDVAGTVEAVGRNVTQHLPGDEVFGWSTAAFAEFTAAKEHQFIAKPKGISLEEAAGLPLAGCVALQAVRDIAHTKPGHKVLVNGASGGIGSLAVQIAKAYGAQVTGVCSTPNLDFVRSLGADRVIDYTNEDFTHGSERYDLIFDIADRHTLAQRRRVLTRHGTLIPNSGEGGPWLGSIGRIFKAWIVSPVVSQKLRPFLSMTKTDDLTALADMVDDGTLTPVVGATYPLSDAGAAIAHAGSGHARGKIIVVVE